MRGKHCLKNLNRSYPVGQSSHCSPNKQNGGNPFPEPIGSNNTVVELLSFQKDHNYCRIFTGSPKRGGRQGIQNIQGHQQLEITAIPIQAVITSDGRNTNGLVCRQNECPKDSL